MGSLPTREADALIRRVARTFSRAARLLPADVRDDVNLLYLVVRTLDDLVDARSPAAGDCLDQVERWALRGEVTCWEAEVLAHLSARYPDLPRDAIVDFCAGQRSDLEGLDLETEADLDRYCYQVAGTVGRLMATLLGARGPRADSAARALGIAMQRTNVLRDIDEDLAVGRLYIPRQTLEMTQVDDLAGGDRSRLLRVEAAVADWWYEQGLAGLPELPRGRFAIRAAARMYREILRQIERDGWGAQRPKRSRVSAARQIVLIAASLRLRDGGVRRGETGRRTLAPAGRFKTGMDDG